MNPLADRPFSLAACLPACQPCLLASRPASQAANQPASQQASQSTAGYEGRPSGSKPGQGEITDLTLSYTSGSPGGVLTDKLTRRRIALRTNFGLRSKKNSLGAQDVSRDKICEIQVYEEHFPHLMTAFVFSASYCQTTQVSADDHV